MNGDHIRLDSNISATTNILQLGYEKTIILEAVKISKSFTHSIIFYFL